MFITKQEAAKYFKVSVRTIERRIKNGDLIGHKPLNTFWILVKGIRKDKQGNIVNI